MPTITRQPPLSPKWIPKRLGRLTVDQYEAMVDSDAFTKHDNFVLINGYLVTKVTRRPPHVIAGELLRDELLGLVPRSHWRVMVEAPVRIPDYNEPEPDVSVARGKANKDIARALFISENTVKNHVRNILEKLQLHSRMEAAMYAVREKLLDVPQ